MQRPTKASLQDALQTALKRGTSVVLATVSSIGEPATAFCSWVVGVDSSTIALALDSRSTAHRNISGGSTRIALEVMIDDLAVRGEAQIVKEQLKSVPFPCALVTVSIAEVRDHGVDGVVFKAPHYLFADGKEHRGEVERTIFEELARAAREHHKA